MERGNSAAEQAARKLRHAAELRAQADRVERSGAMWQRGAEGEELVAAQLERLRAYGFDVFHDVHWPGRQRANIDHVAVGPPGILVVDAKNWSGNVTVRDGVLRQNGYRRENAVAGAREAAQDVGSLLQLPWALHVIPVIALADSSTGTVEQCSGVTVLGHTDLVGWATGLEPQLTPGDVHGIAEHLRASMPSVLSAGALTPPRPHGDYRAPRTLPREPSARERKRAARRAAARREALLKLAAVALFLVLTPTLVTWWSGHGAGVVHAVVPTPTSTTSVTPAPTTARTFTTCRALRSAYPAGVKRAGASNTGGAHRGHPVLDAAAYRANSGLDHDHDGIACELPRRHGSH